MGIICLQYPLSFDIKSLCTWCKKTLKRTTHNWKLLDVINIPKKVFITLVSFITIFSQTFSSEQVIRYKRQFQRPDYPSNKSVVRYCLHYLITSQTGINHLSHSIELCMKFWKLKSARVWEDFQLFYLSFNFSMKKLFNIQSSDYQPPM